jgi:hypothetical protein
MTSAASETCPDCHDAIDDPICLLESFETFGAVMCDPCFERRCEARLDAAIDGAPTPPTDDGDPDEWAAIIPY